MNLKDLLQQARYEILPDKEETRRGILRSVDDEQAQADIKPVKIPAPKRSRLWIAGLAASLLILLGLGWFTYRYFSLDPSSNITGDIRSLSEIVYVSSRDDASGSLDIVTRHRISTRELSSHIAIEPKVGYTVRKKGVNRFTLTFDEPLPADTAYTVNSVSSDKVLYQWSLQAEKKFGIQNVYPETATDGYADVETTIEITLTESSVNNLEPFFSIEPAVEGSFRHNGRTWIFLPNGELAPYTTYTVRISGELIGKDEEQPLGEDREFRFTTGFSDKKYAYVLKDGEDLADTFLSGEEPAVKVVANGMSGNTADLSVYRIPDADAYKKLHEKYDGVDILPQTVSQDIAAGNMKKYLDFSASAVKAPGEENEYYFLYPQKLENGYYLTEIVWSGVTLYQIVQITDLSVYAVNGNNDIAVWVNDTRTKLPAENAKVILNEKNEKSTDASGIAVFKNTATDQSRHILTVRSDSLPDYIAYLPNFERAEKTKYFTYFYTNSSVYRPTDTVKVWGCVLKRDAAARDPDVKLHSVWNDADHAVTLEKNGTFSLEIPLTQYRLTDEIELTMLIGDEQVSSKLLTVAEYDLPVYSLTSKSNKNAYFAGETATTDLSVRYYDGTPASGLTIDMDEESLLTDKNGTASYSQTVTAPEDMMSYIDTTSDPYVKTQYWDTGSALEQPFYTENTLLIFRNREYVTASVASGENRKYTAEIQTHKTDLSKLNEMDPADITAMYGYVPEENYRGEAVTAEVTAEVHSVTYERAKTGTAYDIESRRTVATYEFTPVDTVIKTYNIHTKDGKATLDDISVPDTDGYAYIKFLMTDSAGSQAFCKVYVIPERYSYGESYILEADTRDVDVDDTVTLSVKTSDTLRTLQEGSFVYIAVSDEIYETVYTNRPIAPFVFKKEYIPAIRILGAYFDGKNMYDLSTDVIRYDTDHAKLNVSVTPDKKTCAPGDTVALTVGITDDKGDPVAAAFNINVMDAALLDAYDNDFDILSSLYADTLYLYRTSSFVSHRDFESKSYGEGGGGGGGDVRSDFEDTPAFICGNTGKNGTAKVEIKLSDSLTTWCVIAQCVTADARAGSAETTVVSTKDLFITANRTAKFKPEDDVVTAFRCDGAKAAGDAVTTVTVLKNDTAVFTQTLTHPVRQTQFINCGKLAAGDYKVRIASANGANKDTIEYTLAIQNSFLTVTTVTDDMTDVNGVGALFLFDENQKAYTERIERLLTNSAARLDQMLGREIAASLAENPSGDAADLIDRSILDSYEKIGYASYPMDSDADAVVSAIVASLLGENTATEHLNYYFNEMLTDPDATREDILIALWGKAALGQPVNADLTHYYADGNAISDEQQLYFALAFSYGGNQTKANDIYSGHIKPLLKKDGGHGLYLENEDEYIKERNNVLLAILASRISSADTEKIMAYHDAQNSGSVYTRYADAANLLYYVPLLEGKNKAEIVIDGESVNTVEYDKFAPYRMILTKGAGKIEIRSLEGVTYGQVKKSVSGGALLKENGQIGEIACLLDGTSEDGITALNVGDTVILTLDFPSGAQDGCVDVILPAGLQFDSAPDESANISLQPNKSHLKVYGNATDTTVVDVVLRAVLPGEFTLEPAIQFTANGASYRASAAKTILISPVY